MATELAKAYVQIVPSAEGITGSITNVMNGEAGEAGKSSGESLAKSLGSTFKSAFVALGVGKIISDAIGGSSEFESGMAQVRTLFSGTEEEFSQLTNDILGLSSAYGISTSELTAAAYSAESAGVSQENLMAMLTSSAELAKAGFTDLDTALSATAKTMNAYGEASGTIDEVQKVLIQTQNLGITTVGELGASLANVTPTAAAMGVSFDQVGASLALMTAKGTPTAQATTQLRAAMVELGKSGTKGAEALSAAAEGTKYAGMSFKEMMANGADLGEVMSMMQAYADKTGLSMVDLFSSVEAGNAAMSIASDVETFNRDLEAMGTTADVVGEGYKTMAKTFAGSMTKMKTSVKNLGIALMSGMDIGPALDSLIESLSDVLSGAGEMILTMLKGIFDNLPQIFNSFAGLGTTLLAKLKEVDWLSLGKSILEGICGVLDNAGTWLHNLFQTGLTAIKNIDWKQVGTAIWNGITKLIDSAGKFLSDLFGTGLTSAEGLEWSGIGTAIWNGVTGVITTAGTWLSGLFKTGITEVGKLNFGSIGSTIKTAVTGILNPEGENFLGKIFKEGETKVAEIDWEALGKNVATAGAELINLTGEALAGGFTAAETIIKTIDWNALGTTVGNAANGLISLTGEALSAAFTAAETIIKTIDWNAVGTTVGNAANGLVSLTGEVLSAAFTAAEATIKAIDWTALGTTVGNAANGLISLTDAALSGAFTAAKTTIETIDWEGIGKNTAVVANGLIGLSGDTLSGAFTAAETTIKAIDWTALGTAIAGVPNAMIAAAGAGGELLKAPFEAAQGFISGVNWEELGSTVQSGLSTAFQGVTDALGGVLSGIGAAAGGVGEGIGAAASGFGKWIGSLFSGDDLTDLENKVQRLETAMTNMQNAITTAASESGTKAKEVSKVIKEGIQSELLTDSMKNIGKNAVMDVVAGINDKKADIQNTMKSVRESAKTAMNNDGNWKSVGENIIAGLKKGIDAKKQTIIDALKELAKKALEAAKKELGISSPSRVMANEVGRWIPEGIAAGIEKYSGVIDGAMDEIAGNLAGERLQASLMTQARGMRFGTEGENAAAGGGFTQQITINSPEALTPSEIARQTRIQTQNMVLRMMGA